MTDETNQWVEINIHSDGIGVSVYEDESERVTVVDETWLTDAEIEEIRAKPDADRYIILANDEA